MQSTTNTQDHDNRSIDISQYTLGDMERIPDRSSNTRQGQRDDSMSPGFEKTPDQVRVRPRQEDDDRFEQKELPKTINSVFGSIEDFLNFFVKRNPEIRDFAKLYKEIEETKDLKRLNTIICPELATCIRKESQKEALLSKEEANPAILFEKEFDTFDQFYAEVLRAYTMSSFLYRNLNRYMRNEDWNAFNDLLPYAFGLCKTFFCQQFTSDLTKHAQMKTRRSSSSENITLYRGASFDKDALAVYDPETLKNFSWHSVTSTTTNPTVAKRFMGGGNSDSRYAVLFMIEASLMNKAAQKHLSYIDMRPFSEYKTEDEVILPPGSVFTLQEINSHKDGFKIIKLKLISDVGALSHEGLIMPGAMQSRMMTETEVKIMCVYGSDLLEALKHVAGNSLIQEIEFCLCKFDFETLKKMTEKILPTMSALHRLKFISCSYDYQKNHVLDSFKNFSKIQKIEIGELDERFYKVLIPLSNHITSFDFAFADINKVTSQTLIDLSIDGLQNLPQLQCLNLDLTRCGQLTDQDIANLCNLGLKKLTKLLSLSLNFAHCKAMTDQSLIALSTDGIHPFLTSLALNFAYCKLITDHGISLLSKHSLPRLTSFSLCIQLIPGISDQSLVNLTSQYPLLTNLDLDFNQCLLVTQKSFESLPKTLSSLKLDLTLCDQLTDASIISLSNSLLPLTQLNSLDISLSRCSKLTSQAISQLSSQILPNLSDLISLNLDLSSCRLITDEALKDLVCYALKALTKLTSLSLNLESCDITNESLNSLSLTALPSLILLQSFSLNLYWCSSIDDEGIIALFTTGLPRLKSLTSLDLNLSVLYKLSDEGIKGFCSQGLSQLTNLQSLSINFSRCGELTDQGLQQIFAEGLKFLTNLTTLNLNLNKCPKITQGGVDTLEAQISQSLLQLTSLTIHFKVFSAPSEQYFLMVGNMENCVDPEMSLSLLCERNQPVVAIAPKSQLQDELQESLFKVVFETQQPFTHPSDPKFSALSTFHLSFFDYPHASAENVLTLASQGLKYLTHLTSLHLDFSKLPARTELPAIMDQTFAEFCSEGLHPLQGGLTSLTLNLQQCSNLTDQVVDTLCSLPLEYFSFKLTSFSLQLGWCERITDQAIEVLCLQGLKKLPSLKSLDLAFQGCKKVTDQGLKTLGAHIPTQLTSLSLDFGECPAISDAGFRCLVENRNELEVLNLRFPRTNITNEALMMFASQEMSQLKELGLNFESCDEIGDEGVDALCRDGLRKLKGLEKLVLEFEDCQKVTDVAVNDFCSVGLRNLKMLKELKFYFEHCLQISDFTRKHIKKILQYFGFKITKLDY